MAIRKKKSPKKPSKRAAKKTAKPSKAKSVAVKSKSSQTSRTTKSVTTGKGIDWSNFFTPLDNRVLVELEETAAKTAGGLYIPDSVRESNNRAIVRSVGIGHRNKKGQLRPLDVRVGDRIIIAQFAGNEINIGGLHAMILREEDILGIIET